MAWVQAEKLLRSERGGDCLKGGEQFGIGFGVNRQIMRGHADDCNSPRRVDPDPLAMNANRANLIIIKAGAVPFAAIGAAIKQT